MKSTDPFNELTREVGAQCRRCGVPPDAPLLVACSGGADSTALLVLLHRLQAPIAGCAYFDHGLRDSEETGADRRAVRRLAEKHGIPFETDRAEPGGIRKAAREQGTSLEDEARRARYRFLAEVAERLGCRYVAVGHTRDDQVETVLMRILQGTDLEGLSGMSACSRFPFTERREPFLLRPLLTVDRAALREQLRLRGIGFRDDPSNEDTSFLRNALRREVIPAVEEVVPSFRRGVAATAQRISEAAEYVSAHASRALEWRALETASGTDPARRAVRSCRPARALAAGRDAFFALPTVLRRRALYRAFDRLGVTEKRIPYRFVDSIPEVSPQKNRGVLLRGHGIRVELDGRLIVCRRDVVSPGERGYLHVIRSSGAARADDGRRNGAVDADDATGDDEPAEVWELRLRGGPGAAEETVRLRGERVFPPLILRSRRAGDVIALKKGRRAVKRVLQDQAVPGPGRAAVPILEDRAGIVGVCGGLMGGRSAWRNGVLGEPSATEGNGFAIRSTGVGSPSERLDVDLDEVLDSDAERRSEQ
ncbi:MAG: tRNA lysidine(34) synthetase TilS [Spirochaetaceae bacterium]